MRDHKELEVWKYSMGMVTEIYSLTTAFPKEELYGLTNQVRRAAVSIPSNIAEGASRQTEKEFVQFLYIALASAAELETQIIIANNLGYLIDSDSMLNRIMSVRKMLNGLIRHYRNKVTTRA
ncbi:four helix bundle protein [Geomobilimonas luticola]|uniref:Four helix bundle protein n=1 Tax=Geomobilimonas luticola TaxID=1114878 RepID=A0ABS5SEI7_9BACT|nr:four helix bundle protein [Geomobilimonas luticola]MBT0653778.1 four helix bundle protein [Geomobilimonas luticola]